MPGCAIGSESAAAGSSLLDRVRAACASVAERAQQVRIASDPAEYAAGLLSEEHLPVAQWDEDTHFRGSDEETVAFVISLDAVNFGSGYFPHLEKRPGMSGYFTVALSLKERFEKGGPPTARELEMLTEAEVARLFGQKRGDPVRDELLRHFTAALNELGEFLELHFSGSFMTLARSARGSAEGLAGILSAMPHFRDVASYRGRAVPLLKRAQIAASDLALALENRAPANFSDLEKLTIFADNLVPHVLRLDGVLEYRPELVERLERGDLLPAGSPEEVEIRAVALHAVELMVAGLRVEGRPVTSRMLDLVIWNRGQAPRYRGGSKHRTRTIFY